MLRRRRAKSPLVLARAPKVASSASVALLPDRERKSLRLSPRWSLVVERFPESRAVSAGIFVGFGSRHESKVDRGLCHLLEHLVFKGSSLHSAEELSRRVEGHGGELNAYTDRELTNFHVLLPAAQVQLAIELLFELVLDPKLSPDDFESERQVVVEELRGYKDSPEDEFWDLAPEFFLNKSALGLRVAGSIQEVQKLKASQLAPFYGEQFLDSQKVLVVCGPHTFEEVHSIVRSTWDEALKHRFGSDLKSRRSKRVLRSETKSLQRRPSFPKPKVQKAKFDQVHVAICHPSVPLGHKDENIWVAATSHLGLGSTSRLFQEVREKRGLAYSAGSTLMSFSDWGGLLSYCSSSPSNASKAVRVMKDVFRELAQSGLSPTEFDFVVSSLEGGALLSDEGVASRMDTIGRSVLLLGRVYGLREQLSSIQKLRRSQLNEVFKAMQDRWTGFAYGPCSKQLFV
jgi:predicted Zn-dependent peptidase